MATIDTNLKDQIISETLLQAFVRELTPLSAFSTSYSGETVKKGETVNVPLYANLTATTFASYEQTASNAVSAVQVNVTTHKVVPVSITDREFVSSSSADVTKWAFQAGKAAAQAVISGVWSLITTANFGAAGVVTTASGFTVAGVRALRKALSQAHVPTDNRSLIVDSNYYDNLLSDSTNVLANLNFGPSAIKDGAINRLGGFDIFESQLIPSSGSTSDGNNMFGFAAHQSAIAVAIRALQPQAPSEYLETKVMTDDASGASIGFRRHYNPGTGIHYLNAEVLFGYAVGITAGLKRIISTT